MKQSLWVIIAAFELAIFATATAYGEDYTYENNNGTIAITGYTGAGGELVFPSEVNGLPVTGIGDSTFYRCTSLTSLTIPDSITSIGDYAFYGCSGLTTVTIPDSVTKLGGGAFCGCASLSSVTIGNGVRSLDPTYYWGPVYVRGVIGTFEGCHNLTNIIIPNSVTNIGSDGIRILH